jgi:hypothetical protein
MIPLVKFPGLIWEFPQFICKRLVMMMRHTYGAWMRRWPIEAIEVPATLGPD